MKHRRLFILISIPLLALVAMATAIGLIIDAPHLLLLQRQHEEISGRVIHVLPNSHGAIEIGCVSSALVGPLNTARIVGDILALSACALFLRLAWWRRLTWGGLLRSGGFWIALGLSVAANVVLLWKPQRRGRRFLFALRTLK
jgi:hypothetical protein